MKIAVIMGSKSDYPKLEEGINFLRKYDIEVIDVYKRQLLDRVKALYEAKVDVIVLDSAHGHSKGCLLYTSRCV